MIAERALPRIIGWDVGGAHLKACLVVAGQVHDVMQWPMPLWQGLQHLEAALAAACARWPEALAADDTVHAATMTGEMADLFAHREDGVAALAAALAEHLGPRLQLWAGAAQRWVAPHEARRHWAAIASANWRASAEAAAHPMPEGLWADIGSTTTDLIALRGGRPWAADDDDAARLARGSLVYQGVARTPLCALGQRVPLAGVTSNVMNEFFATTADVYRLTGELAPAHDQHPAADGGAKTLPATRQRLARMVGRDARDASDDDWLALARFWRRSQADEIASQMRRVIAEAGLAADAPVVVAGCGDFLAAELAHTLGRPVRRFADLVAPQAEPTLQAWVQVGAPAVAVALLAAAAQAAH